MISGGIRIGNGTSNRGATMCQASDHVVIEGMVGYFCCTHSYEQTEVVTIGDPR
jgi:adenosylmethionine-8-amino-7-oxononanoate aminotransferase